MPTLPKYAHFDGRHWETGSVCNYLAYQGVKAPHTGKPYSEAMLMGISGGLLMGYFSFAYKGIDPHVAILTRNTFDPLNTLLARLGVAQHVLQTTNAQKGLTNLVNTLEDGMPALVWADVFSLPYNALNPKEMWQMYPILVYGHEAAEDTVWIADRASVSLRVTTSELAKARARVKKDKVRVLTLDPPNPDKLPVAIQQGIWDCLKRYTEAPVASAKSNFGFAGFQRWADMLTRPTQKASWEKEFPAGVKMYAGLTSTFRSIGLVGKGAERYRYADFLDEASVALEKPNLNQAATQFRVSGRAWQELAIAVLPDEVPEFKETRERMLRRKAVFTEQGNAALPEMKQIDARLETLRAKMKADFPLSADEVVAMREKLSTLVLKVGALEKVAHGTLLAAMAHGVKRTRK